MESKVSKSCLKPFYDEAKNIWLKFCHPCQIIKPVKDFKLVKGRPQCCKPCWNLRQQKYYNQMPLDKKQLKQKKIKDNKTLEQKEARKEYLRQRYNKPEIRERILESQRLRYKPLTKEQGKNHYIKYYDVIKKGMLAYNARKRNASLVIPFTKKEIIERDGLNCYICGKKMMEKQATIDHLVPLSRGGIHSPENVKVCCQTCNARKHTATLDEFLSRINFTFL